MDFYFFYKYSPPTQIHEEDYFHMHVDSALQDLCNHAINYVHAPAPQKKKIKNLYCWNAIFPFSISTTHSTAMHIHYIHTCIVGGCESIYSYNGCLIVSIPCGVTLNWTTKRILVAKLILHFVTYWLITHALTVIVSGIYLYQTMLPVCNYISACIIGRLNWFWSSIEKQLVF